MLERWTAKSKCYIWLYRASRDAKYPIVLYEYQQKPEGGGERCGMFLKGFVGWLCGAAGLQYCNVLFAIEKELDELPSEKLYIQHLSLSRPAMDAFGHGRKRKPPSENPYQQARIKAGYTQAVASEKLALVTRTLPSYLFPHLTLCAS